METYKVDHILDSMYELEMKLSRCKSVHDYKIHKEQVVTKCCDNMFKRSYVFVIKVRLLESDGIIEEIKSGVLELANMIVENKLYNDIEINLLDFMSNRSIYTKKICV